MKRLIIFDLDGTLVNTIADLAASTNHALQQFGFPTHETAKYNYFVGNGIYKLFERALPEEARTQENIQKIRSSFVPYYDEHNTDLSRPYPGIDDMLTALQERGVRMAVVSNKYQAATAKLISYYFPHIRFVSVLGQREGVPTKPDPVAVLQSMEAAGVSPQETFYMGDSNVDMQTGQNAHVDTIGAAWGFRPVEELEAYHPRFIAHQASDVLKFFDMENGKAQ